MPAVLSSTIPKIHNLLTIAWTKIIKRRKKKPLVNYAISADIKMLLIIHEFLKRSSICLNFCYIHFYDLLQCTQYHHRHVIAISMQPVYFFLHFRVKDLLGISILRLSVNKII